MQLEAQILLGLTVNPVTDFSNDIQSIVPKRVREEKVRNPTYGTPRKVTVLGARIETAQIRFYSTHLSAGLFALLWSAQETASGIVFFSAKPTLAAVSVDNPRFTGELMVSSLDLFAAAGEEWEQTQTWPARNLQMITIP